MANNAQLTGWVMIWSKQADNSWRGDGLLLACTVTLRRSMGRNGFQASVIAPESERWSNWYPTRDAAIVALESRDRRANERDLLTKRH